MAVWKLQRLGTVSSLTGEPFPPDTEIVTALFGEDEETGEDRVRGSDFVRRDYLASEATEEMLAGAFCVWRTRTPPPKAGGARRFDLGLAREFLQRLLDEGREDRHAVCLTLALLLARKRRLVILEQRDDVLRVRWPREKRAFDVPAPVVTDAEAEALQQEMLRLFELQGDEAPAEAPAEDAGEEAGDGPASPEEATT